MFAPLGIAYIVSILASLVTSVTVTPVLSSYLLSGSDPTGTSGTVSSCDTSSAANRALLAWAFDHRGLVIGLVALGRRDARLMRQRSCRAASCRPSTRARSSSRCSTIREYRSPSRTGSGLIAERLIAQVPEVKSVGRRTGRAELDEHAEGVHFSEVDVDLARSTRSKNADLRRHSRAPVRAAGFRRHRPADQPSARPPAVGHPCPDRPEDLRRRSRNAAPSRRDRAPAARRGAGHRRSSGREAGAHPAAAHPGRLRARRALRPDAGGGDAGARCVVERPPRLADRRRQPALRRGDAPLRPGSLHHRPARSSDRDAHRARAARPVRRGRRDRRTEPDPARRHAAAHRRLRQRRRQPRHGGDRGRHPAPSSPT